MPKTVWRPNPFDKPLNKFDNAEHQRQRIINLLKRENRPMTMREIAERLDIGGRGYYGKARRYAMAVANPTHDLHRPKRPPDIGWTLKPEYQ